MGLKYDNKLPGKEEFYQLYQTTGWNTGKIGVYSQDDLHKAIRSSWYLITVYDKENLVGFGRIVSDGVYQTFITDVIVHPDYQGKGTGAKIMNLLMKKCKESGIQWIQLSCAKGKKEFYKNLGFRERDVDAPGMQRLI